MKELSLCHQHRRRDQLLQKPEETVVHLLILILVLELAVTLVGNMISVSGSAYESTEGNVSVAVSQ